MQFVCESTPLTKSPTTSPTESPTLMPTPSVLPLPPTSSKYQKNTHAPTATPTPTCPKGFTWLEESCYALVNTAKSWSAANTTCSDHSSWLATLSSNNELQRVVEWLQHIGGLDTENSGNGPFIGLFKPTDESDSSSSFRWAPSSDSPLTSFRHWAEGFPSFPSGNEDCVHLDENGYFENTVCTDIRGFVCEAAGTLEVPTAAAVGDSSAESGHGLFLSLFIPISLFAAGMLFYYFVIRERSPRGPWAPVGSSSKKGSGSGPFSAMDDESEGASSHALVGTEMQDLSRFDPLDGSSPEETMEIQLQMRSYAPLKAGQGSFPV
jgi:hypothetical protein